MKAAGHGLPDLKHRRRQPGGVEVECRPRLRVAPGFDQIPAGLRQRDVGNRFARARLRLAAEVFGAVVEDAQARARGRRWCAS